MSFDTPFELWLALGILLVFAEFVVPGLVVIFLGLGALSVAGLIYLKFVESIAAQLSTWFIISTVYIFSLRILVMRYYPTDSEKQEIDEDKAMVGQVVEVIEKISAQHNARIRFGESTWTAIYRGSGEIYPGESVRIVDRDNICWVVEKVSKEF